MFSWWQSLTFPLHVCKQIDAPRFIWVSPHCPETPRAVIVLSVVPFQLCNGFFPSSALQPHCYLLVSPKPFIFSISVFAPTGPTAWGVRFFPLHYRPDSFLPFEVEFKHCLLCNASPHLLGLNQWRSSHSCKYLSHLILRRTQWCCFTNEEHQLREDKKLLKVTYPVGNRVGMKTGGPRLLVFILLDCKCLEVGPVYHESPHPQHRSSALGVGRALKC